MIQTERTGYALATYWTALERIARMEATLERLQAEHPVALAKEIEDVRREKLLEAWAAQSK